MGALNTIRASLWQKFGHLILELMSRLLSVLCY